MGNLEGSEQSKGFGGWFRKGDKTLPLIFWRSGTCHLLGRGAGKESVLLPWPS